MEARHRFLVAVPGGGGPTRSRVHERTLCVLAANDIGRRFYEQHGWQIEGARQTYPIGGVELEEIRYRIEL
jgi:hypothetical protein